MSGILPKLPSLSAFALAGTGTLGFLGEIIPSEVAMTAAACVAGTAIAAAILLVLRWMMVLLAYWVGYGIGWVWGSIPTICPPNGARE